MVTGREGPRILKIEFYGYELLTQRTRLLSRWTWLSSVADSVMVIM